MKSLISLCGGLSAFGRSPEEEGFAVRMTITIRKAFSSNLHVDLQAGIWLLVKAGSWRPARAAAALRGMVIVYLLYCVGCQWLWTGN